ncbi:MAG: hypothetical protein IJR87_02890 [Bacteroidaceae bacterium]|nr:hypothetical protein [Bacteroidaceae bacterium]
MDKIDDILQRLGAQQPDIANPGDLTDRIMANLPDKRETPLQQEAVTTRTYRFVTALHIVSSMAAVLLVGLFLYVNKPLVEARTKTNKVPHYYTNARPAGSTLKDVYTNRRQRDRLISYTQLRKKYYEEK